MFKFNLARQMLILFAIFSGFSFAASPSGKVTVSAPTYVITNTNFNISFGTVSGATYYKLFENGSVLTTRTSGPVRRKLLSSGTRSYYVQACNSSGCGPNSNTIQVHAGTKPSKPSLSAPSQSQVGVIFNLSFGSVSGAKNYKLYENGSLLTVRTTSPIARRIYQPGTYSYYLTACNDWGCSTNSNSVTVQVGSKPAKPSLSAPAKSIAGSTFNLSFGQVSGATSYKLYENSSLLTVRTSGPIQRRLYNTGTYTYYLTACNTFGCSSSSNSVTVDVGNVPAAPQIQLPTNGKPHSAYNISFNTVASATNYQLFENNSLLANRTSSPIARVVYDEGTYQYFIRACNEFGCSSNSNVASINVEKPNSAPQAIAQSLTTNEETPLNIVLNGTDPDNDNLSYQISRQPTKGTLSGNGANLVYTPKNNLFGSDSFNFTVSDGQYSSSAQVSIIINNLNDKPTGSIDTNLSNGVISGSCSDEVVHRVRIWLDNDHDYGIDAGKGDLVLGEVSCDQTNGGKFHFAIPQEYKGQGAKNYRVLVLDYDVDGTRISGSINYTDLGYHLIEYNNDAPIISDITTSVPSGTTINKGDSINISIAGSDPDGEITESRITIYNAQNTAVVSNLNNSYEWTPSESGDYTIQANLTDNNGSTSQETIPYTVVFDPSSATPVVDIVSGLYKNTGVIAQFNDEDRLIFTTKNASQVSVEVGNQEVPVNSISSRELNDAVTEWTIQLNQLDTSNNLAPGYYEIGISVSNEVGEQVSNTVPYNVCVAGKRKGQLTPEQFGASIFDSKDDSESFTAMFNCASAQMVNYANLEFDSEFILQASTNADSEFYCLNENVTLPSYQSFKIISSDSSSPTPNKAVLKQCQITNPVINRLIQRTQIDNTGYRADLDEFANVRWSMFTAAVNSTVNQIYMKDITAIGFFANKQNDFALTKAWSNLTWSQKQYFDNGFISIASAGRATLTNLTIKDFAHGIKTAGAREIDINTIANDGFLNDLQDASEPYVTADFKMTPLGESARLQTRLDNETLPLNVKHPSGNWTSAVNLGTVFPYGHLSQTSCSTSQGEDWTNDDCKWPVRNITSSNSGAAVLLGSTSKDVAISNIQGSNIFDNCTYVSSGAYVSIDNVECNNASGVAAKVRGPGMEVSNIEADNVTSVISVQPIRNTITEAMLNNGYTGFDAAVTSANIVGVKATRVKAYGISLQIDRDLKDCTSGEGCVDGRFESTAGLVDGVNICKVDISFTENEKSPASGKTQAGLQILNHKQTGTSPHSLFAENIQLDKCGQLGLASKLIDTSEDYGLKVDIGSSSNSGSNGENNLFGIYFNKVKNASINDVNITGINKKCSIDTNSQNVSISNTQGELINGCQR